MNKIYFVVIKLCYEESFHDETWILKHEINRFSLLPLE